MPTNNAWNSQNPAQVARGGTGRATIAVNDIIIGYNANPVVLVAPDPVVGIPFKSNGLAANPGYGTAVVAGGGTGTTAYTPYTVICAGTAAQTPFQNVVGTGTAGQILTSNGAVALPSWQNAGFGQYAFFAYNNVLNGQTHVTGNNTEYHVRFQTTTFNDAGVWDTVNSRFVAPANGLYYISYNVLIVAASASLATYTYDIYLRGPIPYRTHQENLILGPTIDSLVLQCTASCLLNTNDIVYPALKINGFGGLNAGLSDTTAPFSSWITGFFLTDV